MKKKLLLATVAIAAILSFRATSGKPEAPKNLDKAYKPASQAVQVDAYTQKSGTPKPAAQTPKPATKPTAKPAATQKPAAEASIEDQILELASLESKPEKDTRFCVVDIESDENPYGVDWDYGRGYDRFTKKLDWSMVFDASFYMEQFPFLAMQYQNDEALLLEHFRTVGIHEGRLASKDFDVSRYMDICPAEIKNLFGDSYAAYYLYYLAGGHIAADADAVKATDSSRRQLTAVMTLVQTKELNQINKERESLGASPLEFNPELAALAEYRAWNDVKDDWAAHDWMEANKATGRSFIRMFGTSVISENTVKSTGSSPITNWYSHYKASKPHYDAMVSDEYAFIGISNPHTDSSGTVQTAQFDMFLREDASTPLD